MVQPILATQLNGEGRYGRERIFRCGRRVRGACLALAFWLFFSGVSSAVFAQSLDAANPGSSENRTKESAANEELSSPTGLPRPPLTVNEVGPGLVWLPDKNGGYIPLPGWSYQDVARLLQGLPMSQQGTVQPVLKRVAGEGELQGEFIAWRLEYHFDQVQDGSSVDLGLANCLLPQKEPAAEAMDQAAHVQLSLREDGGFSAKFSEIKSSSLSMVVTVRARCQRFGSRRETALLLPACLSSEIRIHTDARANSAQLVGAGVVTQEATEGKQEIVVRGLSGLGNIAWLEPSDDVWVSDIEAISKLTVNVTPDRARVTADISLSQPTGEIRPLRLLLPAEAERVTPSASADYEMRAVPLVAKETSKNANALTGAVSWELVPLRQGVSRIEASLSYELPLGEDETKRGALTNDNAESDKLGNSARWISSLLRIEGAASHKGEIRLTSPDDWNLEVAGERGISRLYVLPVNNTNSPSIQSIWQFLAEDYSFQIQCERRPPRITVTPTYNCSIGLGQAELEAEFQFQITGRPVDELQVDLGDWRLREATWQVASDELGPVTQEAGSSLLRARLDGPRMGSVTFKLAAERTWSRNEAVQTWTWPRPANGQSQSAMVRIRASDSVNFTFRPAGSRGHSPRTNESPEPNTFQFVASQRDARFAFAAIPASAKSTANQFIQAVVGGEKASLRVELTLDAQGESADSLEFSLPETAENVQGSWGDSKLTFKSQRAGSSGSQMLWQFTKPAGTPFASPLRLQWDDTQSFLGLNVLASANERSSLLPDWKNIDVRTTRAEIFPNDRGAIESVALVGPGDTLIAESKLGNSSTLLTSLEPCAALRWTLEERKHNVPSVVRVPRAFLQTWITNGACQQYASLVVETNEPRIKARFPQDAAMETIGIRIRRQGSRQAKVITASSLATDRGGDVFIPLSEQRGADPLRYSVEIVYRLPELPFAKAFRLGPPINLPNVWVDQSIWQIAHPKSTVLMRHGDEWSSITNLSPWVSNGTSTTEQSLREWAFSRPNAPGTDAALAEGSLWNPGSPQGKSAQAFFIRSGELAELQIEITAYGRACLIPSMAAMAALMFLWVAPARYVWAPITLASILLAWVGFHQPWSLGHYIYLGWPGAAAALAWRLGVTFQRSRVKEANWRDAPTPGLWTSRPNLQNGRPDSDVLPIPGRISKSSMGSDA